MTMRVRACCMLIALVASACAQEVFVATETRELFGDHAETFEQFCGPAFDENSGASSFGFGAAPAVDGSSGFVDDLAVERIVVGAELQVRVRSGGVTLAARGFGRRFLESGKLDSFTVMTRNGRRFEFLHQGGPDCESIELFNSSE